MPLLALANELAPAYAAAKRERGALDFTDLLLLPLALLAGHADLRLAYQQRWPHVFVDEYQDVNVFQYLLLRLLVPPGGDLCAIGDSDQAIYGFRGADVRYFLRFRQDYPGAGQISLSRNYRSTRTIVQASAQVIARNSLRSERTLWSDIAGPAQLELSTLPTSAAEAEYVVERIEALLGGISHYSVDSGRSGDGTGANLGFNDIAVLYRTHAVGEELQQAFARSGIPYQRAARKDVYLRPDVRKVLALLTRAAEGVQSEAGLADLACGTQPSTHTLSSEELPATLDPFLTEIAHATPTAVLLLAAHFAGVHEEALARPPWTLLLSHAREASDLPALLRAINLDREPDLYDPRAARVALMTAHAAKGLEWEVVFLIGCEEGCFPHPAAPADEERRLFYVAMTRARRHLYLSYARSHLQHGERSERRPSLFLQDISPELLQMITHKAKRRGDEQMTMSDLFG